MNSIYIKIWFASVDKFLCRMGKFLIRVSYKVYPYWDDPNRPDGY